MDKSRLVTALVALAIVAATALGLSLSNRDSREPAEKVEFVEQKADRRPLSDPCSSSETYARLKQVAFEEAVRIRNADPTNLDTLATHSVVRMENPEVRSSDEEAGVTVCAGRFVLELPPGAERAFGGDRRLVADVEFTAQAGEGGALSYQMNGAEPIIYKLAAFDLQGNSYLQSGGALPEGVEFADAAPVVGGVGGPDDGGDEAEPAAPPAAAAARPAPPPVRSEPEPRPAPQPRAVARAEPKAAPKAAPKAEPKERPKQLAKAERPEPRRPAEARAASARPSFNCRAGRSRSEQMVCSNSRLAAKDRAMSSVFYSALAAADARKKRRLRQTRDRFLAYRERCVSEACVAEAYDGRVEEIRDIMAGLE